MLIIRVPIFFSVITTHYVTKPRAQFLLKRFCLAWGSFKPISDLTTLRFRNESRGGRKTCLRWRGNWNGSLRECPSRKQLPENRSSYYFSFMVLESSCCIVRGSSPPSPGGAVAARHFARVQRSEVTVSDYIQGHYLLLSKARTVSHTCCST